MSATVAVVTATATATTATATTTPTTSSINGNDQVHLPYARLESPHFGVYDVWQEKTIIGKKSKGHDVDVNIGMRI